MTATIEDPTVRDEIEIEYALPELADTMEEADARASASTFLYVLGKVQGEHAANNAEYKNLQIYQLAQQTIRQEKLDAQIDWLTERLEGLFGMMDPGKKKSLNLLGGQLGHRKQTEELVVEDDLRSLSGRKQASPPK